MKHWRAANILTLPALSSTFFLMIFIEPFVLLPAVLIGSNRFPDAWIDQVFNWLGETSALMMGLAFLGFFIWMIVFILLSNLSRGLRHKLPIVPLFEKTTRGHQSSTCERCGGTVVYHAAEFACLCDYCSVINFRVQFTRREQVNTQTKITDAKSLLFGALQIIEEYVGTFFFIMSILVIGAIIMTILALLQQLL